MQAPRTPRESIAYVNSQLAAAYQSVADTVQAGTLDKSRGRVFVDKLNEVSRSVDAAEGFLKPCETAKVNCDKLDLSLATAQKILRTVIVELQAREAVK